MVALHRVGVGGAFGHYWRVGTGRGDVPLLEALCSMPREQFWHATACWLALGHLGRVLHVLSVAGSVPSRCGLVGARAGQGSKEH